MRIAWVLSLLVCGCTSPYTAEGVYARTSLEKDALQDVSWVRGPEYRHMHLRTVGFEGPGELRHELHVDLFRRGWGLYSRAELEDGTPVELTVVERRVVSDELKIEYFKLHLSTDDLRHGAETKLRFRVLGGQESDSLWLSVPPYYYEGYLLFVNEVMAKRTPPAS